MRETVVSYYRADAKLPWRRHLATRDTMLSYQGDYCHLVRRQC